MTCCQIHIGKYSYKYSFFPLAIAQWNTLPENFVTSPSLDLFKAVVGELQHPKPQTQNACFYQDFVCFSPYPSFILLFVSA